MLPTWLIDKRITFWLANPDQDPNEWLAQNVEVFLPEEVAGYAKKAIELGASPLAEILCQYVSDDSRFDVIKSAIQYASIPVIDKLYGPNAMSSFEANRVLTLAIVYGRLKKDATVLKWLMTSPHQDPIKERFQSGEIFPSFCGSGDLEFVKITLPWYQEQPLGAAPLNRAVEAGATDVVRFLLDQGAIPEDPDQLLKLTLISLPPQNPALISLLWPLANPVDIISGTPSASLKAQMVNAASDHLSEQELDQLLSDFKSARWLKNCPILQARKQHHALSSAVPSSSPQKTKSPKM